MEPVPFQLRIVANKEEKEKNGVLETFIGGSSFSMFSTAAFLVNCGFVELLKLSWLVHLVCVHTAALLKLCHPSVDLWDPQCGWLVGRWS